MPLQRAYQAAGNHSSDSMALQSVRLLMPLMSQIAERVVDRVNQLYPRYRSHSGPLNSANIRTSEVENNHTLTTYTASPEGERREITNAGKPNFDPRKRPYYKIPVQQKQAFWGTVYPHITGKFLYIAAGKPIYTKTGDLQGVWMTSLNLVMFGDFLSKLKIGKTGQSFILERFQKSNGLVIGASSPLLAYRAD